MLLETTNKTDAPLSIRRSNRNERSSSFPRKLHLSGMEVARCLRSYLSQSKLVFCVPASSILYQQLFVNSSVLGMRFPRIGIGSILYASASHPYLGCPWVDIKILKGLC